MVLFKEKKNSNVMTRNNIPMTIDYKHQQTLKTFEENRKNLSKMKKQLAEMEKSFKKLNRIPNTELSDDDLKTKLELLDQIPKLQEQIDTIEKGKDEMDYLIKTSHILYQYFDENQPIKTHTSESKGKKTVLDFFTLHSSSESSGVSDASAVILSKYESRYELMDEFLTSVDKDYVKSVDNHNEDGEKCKKCNVYFITKYTEGVLICPNCGIQERILVDNDTPSYKEPPREITYFAYKRINHFNEWIAQFQGKETTDIKDIVFDRIKLELRKENITEMKTVKPTKVRDILKKLNLTKYYEHVNYITNRLTGSSTSIFDQETEEKLRNMFKEIQAPWIKHCPAIRSNFFSYPYILYKFFQLLEKDEYLKDFRLLKSREKLAEADMLWKKICEELRWEFIKTV